MFRNFPPTDLPIHPFSCAEDFERFLEGEHLRSPGIYLKLAKKSSGILSVSSEEAVEVALCFGWINGWGKSLDAQWTLSRYTPRRSKSMWSKKNVNTVSRLVETGRMRPAGIAAVDAAKADGRWDRAYAGPSTIQIPDDFATALAKDSAAMPLFESLNKTARYAVLWRVETASPKSRPKRIETLVEALANGKVPGRSGSIKDLKRKAATKSSKAKTNAIDGPKARERAEASHPLNDDLDKLPRRPGSRLRK